MGEIIALQDYFSSNPKVPSAPAPVADPLIVRTCCLAPVRIAERLFVPTK